jgi:hypothetical protein
VMPTPGALGRLKPRHTVFHRQGRIPNGRPLEFLAPPDVQSRAIGKNDSKYQKQSKS